MKLALCIDVPWQWDEQGALNTHKVAVEYVCVMVPQVNNASVQGAAVDDLRDISRERLERTFNTNVIAMFNLVQVCLMS